MIYIIGKGGDILLTNSWIDWLIKLFIRISGKHDFFINIMISVLLIIGYEQEETGKCH